MRQYQVGQNRLVETHRTALDETLKILLEPAMSKFGAEHLVLAEQQEEGRRGHTNHGNGLGKGARDFAHQLSYFTRMLYSSGIHERQVRKRQNPEAKLRQCLAPSSPRVRRW